MQEINETITRRWMHHCTTLHTAVALDCIPIILRRRRIRLHILSPSPLKDKPICSLSMEDTRVEYWTVWREVENAFCMKDRCNRSGRKGAIWWRSEWYIKDTVVLIKSLWNRHKTSKMTVSGDSTLFYIREDLLQLSTDVRLFRWPMEPMNAYSRLKEVSFIDHRITTEQACFSPYPASLPTRMRLIHETWRKMTRKYWFCNSLQCWSLFVLMETIAAESLNAENTENILSGFKSFQIQSTSCWKKILCWWWKNKVLHL